jgi:hypothetical protein
MSKITLKKWKQIGRICGYDGTRTASVWSKDADRLRRACSYGLWRSIGKSAGYNNVSQENPADAEGIIKQVLYQVYYLRTIPLDAMIDNIENPEIKSFLESIKGLNIEQAKGKYQETFGKPLQY